MVMREMGEEMRVDGELSVRCRRQTSNRERLDHWPGRDGGKKAVGLAV